MMLSNTTLNAICELFEDFEKLRATLKVNIPENRNDINYRRQLLTTSFDGEKLYNGTSGNFFLKYIIDLYLNSLDFVPKFPFKKVNIIYYVVKKSWIKHNNFFFLSVFTGLRTWIYLVESMFLCQLIQKFS